MGFPISLGQEEHNQQNGYDYNLYGGFCYFLFVLILLMAVDVVISAERTMAVSLSLLDTQESLPGCLQKPKKLKNLSFILICSPPDVLSLYEAYRDSFLLISLHVEYIYIYIYIYIHI